MSEPVLLVEKSDGIATLTLNRPKVMNALSQELRESLRQAFIDLSDDPETNVVIITGAGRGFCGGLDLKELSTKGIGIDDATAIPTGESFFFDTREFGRPIIAAINGPAVTGGFELALMCDILIASTSAAFADTHVRVGFIPGAGLSQKLSRLIGIYRAKELSLTGNFISAEQAEAWGLVNRVVPPDELMPACRALAKDIISCPSDVVRKYNRLINEGFDRSFAEGIKLETQVFVDHARQVTAQAVAARREGVQDRGREQKKRGE
jgi:enoyl-CoA hydratase